MLPIADASIKESVVSSSGFLARSFVPIEKSLRLEQQENSAVLHTTSRVVSDTIEVSSVASSIQNRLNSTFVREFDCGSSGKTVIGWCENRGRVFAYATKDCDTAEIKAENMPKDFVKVNSAVMLQKFLENVYVRISTLSDGDTKLYINQKGLGGGNSCFRAAPPVSPRFM